MTVLLEKGVDPGVGGFRRPPYGGRTSARAEFIRLDGGTEIIRSRCRNQLRVPWPWATVTGPPLPRKPQPSFLPSDIRTHAALPGAWRTKQVAACRSSIEVREIQAARQVLVSRVIMNVTHPRDRYHNTPTTPGADARPNANARAPSTPVGTPGSKIITRAHRYNDERERITRSCFGKKDKDGIGMSRMRLRVVISHGLVAGVNPTSSAACDDTPRTLSIV